MKIFINKQSVDTSQLEPGGRFAIGFPKFYNVYRYNKFTNSYSWLYLESL